MKRSRSIKLTLAGLASTLVAVACGPDVGQTVRCYADPRQSSICIDERRDGYMPVYYPMFYNGAYYGPGGYVTTAPPVGSTEYRIARIRSTGTSFSPTGAAIRAPVARGGFGSSASGRAIAG